MRRDDITPLTVAYEYDPGKGERGRPVVFLSSCMVTYASGSGVPAIIGRPGSAAVLCADRLLAMAAVVGDTSGSAWPQPGDLLQDDIMYVVVPSLARVRGLWQADRDTALQDEQVPDEMADIALDAFARRRPCRTDLREAMREALTAALDFRRYMQAYMAAGLTYDEAAREAEGELATLMASYHGRILMASDQKAAAGVTDRNVLTVRLPADIHEDLKYYKFFANRPINDVVVMLIRDFLDGPGSEEISRGMTARTKSMYGEALDKLAEM